MTLASLLSSDGARTLGALVQDLAHQWTANAHACDDLNVAFDALRVIVARAISTVATEWNNGHDLLRVLPPEIQESCLGSLPVSTRCRLSLVCSHWQQKVAILPGIWNCLHLTHWGLETTDLLARSGHVPLDLIVEVGDPVQWETALHPHSSRLRTLELHVKKDTRLSLAFPVPLLEELSIAADHLHRFENSEVLFDQHAPHLRTVRLTGVSVPSTCPAFHSVRILVLTCRWTPLNHLFNVMPRLEVLDIDTHGYSVGLPELPRRSPLRVLRLLDAYVSVEQLVRLGYSRLDVLEVTTATSYTSQFIDALSFWSDSPATVRVHADWEFELVPQSEGGRLFRFAVRPYKWDIFHQIFCEGRATLHHIQQLALPMLSMYGYRPRDPLASVLLGRDSVLTLPGLRTLLLECGGMRPAGDKASPLRECILGMIEAPQLTRIEIVRAADVPWDAQLDCVDIEELVALVENVLVCDDRGALGIFVDTAAGIVLGGDIDKLRKCVGRVVV